MIKFFRTIRQKLLAENKLSRYLIYAIGEIILVVIGILIALQINNQNEAKKTREKEVGYLENVKVDLLNEINNNERFATYHFEKAQAAATLINGEAPQTIKELQTYTDNYEQVFIWIAFVPNNNTFKELLSSGNLSLIKNDSIKNGLLELDNLYAEIAAGEYHMRREFEEYLYNPHVKNIAALEFFNLKDPKYGMLNRLSVDEIPKIKHADLIKDANWQHQDQTFQNGLKLAMMNNSLLAGLHQNLVQYIRHLIKSIEVEIKG